MRARVIEDYAERLERLSLGPVNESGKGFYLFVSAMLAIIAWGGFAYITQLRYGLLMTGMRDIVSWGFYIFNFVFWIFFSFSCACFFSLLFF